MEFNFEVLYEILKKYLPINYLIENYVDLFEK